MEKLIAAKADAIGWWWAVGLFLVFAVLETAWPGRVSNSSTVRRWAENLALYATCIAARYWIVPDALADRIIAAPKSGSLFGVVHQLGGDGLVLVIGILAIDFLFYLLHVVEHNVFVLWRFHAVHHSDQHVDVSTGLRHHPAEVVVNALIANLVVIALGQPVWVSAIYIIVSSTTTLFNHSNVSVPATLERAMGLVLVTPSLHRVHHSTDAAHYNSNFGNVFSIWDRICGTYRQLPAEQGAAIAFGIAPSDATPRFGLLREWLLPFTMRRPRSGRV